MNLKLITPPALEPVSLVEAKAHLRVEIADDDTLIAGLISAARQVCEVHLKRSFISTTWELSLDSFPGSWSELSGGFRRWNPESYQVVWLLNPPLISVSSVIYLDSDGDPQTLPTADYQVVTGTPGRILPVWGLTWPYARCQPESVKVRFVAGYGTTATSVPECIKLAMKLLIGNWYENREPVVIGTIVAPLPFAVKSLLSPEFWGPYS